MGRNFGVAILAEGLIDKLDPSELAGLSDVERDDHGHVRFAEVDLARKVKAEVEGRLTERGLQRHHHPQERRLRAALRRSDPVRRRVLPRPRPVRDPLPGRRRQRRDDQRPGRADGADPVRRPARSGDGQDQGPPGRHRQRRLPRRARLHDPPRRRGLRPRRLGRPPRRGGAPLAGRVPATVRVPRRGRRGLGRRPRVEFEHGHQAYRHPRRGRSRPRHQRRHQRGRHRGDPRRHASPSASPTASSGWRSATPTSSAS